MSCSNKVVPPHDKGTSFTIWMKKKNVVATTLNYAVRKRVWLEKTTCLDSEQVPACLWLYHYRDVLGVCVCTRRSKEVTIIRAWEIRGIFDQLESYTSNNLQGVFSAQRFGSVDTSWPRSRREVWTSFKSYFFKLLILEVWKRHVIFLGYYFLSYLVGKKSQYNCNSHLSRSDHLFTLRAQPKKKLLIFHRWENGFSAKPTAARSNRRKKNRKAKISSRNDAWRWWLNLVEIFWGHTHTGGERFARQNAQ